MTRKQSGFTIIELIVVIALLGILSAVALPRFINVTSEAHNAAVEGAGAGFATGVALLKAQVVANGNLGAATGDVNGYGEGTLDVNAQGYAVGTSVASAGAVSSNAHCAEIFSAILDANGPTVSAGTFNPGGDVDYDAENIGSVSETCRYTYKTINGSTERTISYLASTGAVSVTVE